MKRILFIGMTSNIGGLETFMINIFRELNGKGYKFEFINENPRKKLAYSKEILNNGGKIWNVNIKEIGKGPIKYLRRYINVNSFFKHHHNYDIVHLNSLSINSVYWIRTAKKFGIKKLIIHSHINQNLYKSNIRIFFSNILASFNRSFLNNNKSIIKLAASEKAGHFMFDNNNFQIIDNGIFSRKFRYSSDCFKKIRNELKINYSDKIIITVARIDYQKNYPKIIRIFNNIHKYSSKYKLVIIGWGKDASKIKRMVKEFNLEKYIIFLGKRNDVNKLLSIANLMLMPSLIEAFPFSLIEAQAAGVPAIVSKNVIPQEENITNKLIYISLKKSDEYWSKISINFLRKIYNNNTYYINKRLHMNNIVKNSKYDISNLIRQIKKVYSNKI